MKKRENKKKCAICESNLLLEISHALTGSSDLREVIKPVLKIMSEYMGLRRGTLTIKDLDSGEIFIESAYGLSSKEQARGRYKIGEGIIGKVFEKGKPVIIPKISQEPSFLNKTGSRSIVNDVELSFVCVPILLSREVIGALSGDREFDMNADPGNDVKLLTNIAASISHTVGLHQIMRQERMALEEENERMHRELIDKYRFENIVGRSKRMVKVFEMIAAVCGSPTTVFIQGESGTGKELVASAIHYNSDRSDKPFIKVNCGALPENLVESELFGHEKGAFTGAMTARKGRFELANGGTLFLDEIGDMPMAAQVKLLRVLQEGEFERVGGSVTLRTDVRIIAATNRPLADMVSEKRFREDLYYRFNVFPIYVPALRERKTDILLLADFFINKYNRILKKKVKRLSTSAIDALYGYHWPGNVRELENVIERGVLMSSSGVIHSHHLPPTLRTSEDCKERCGGTLEEILSRAEKDIVMDALKSTEGNLNKAARMLGLTERKMGIRVRKYNIEFKRFRKRRQESACL